MTFKSGIQEVKLELTKNQDNLEGPLHALTFIITTFLMKSLADIQCIKPNSMSVFYAYSVHFSEPKRRFTGLCDF